MKLFVLNCGSSSIKYQIIDLSDEHAVARGSIEGIGQPNARLTSWRGPLDFFVRQSSARGGCRNE